jgi:hypothetical protein
MSTKPTPAEEVAKASQHSTACCSVPPIVAEKEYKAKGIYETIGGFKSCSSIPFPSHFLLPANSTHQT